MASYVLLTKFVEVLEKPVPLDRYLETLLDLWCRDCSRDENESR